VGDPTLPDPGTGARYLSFVLELATRPDVWSRMQAAHVPTAEGFCAAPGCGRGGYGTPHLRWPCPTRLLADWAARAATERARTTTQGRTPLTGAALRRPVR
jgi:hypothetical protein